MPVGFERALFRRERSCYSWTYGGGKGCVVGFFDAEEEVAVLFGSLFGDFL